ncbi:hypothetical protein BDW72DRAFT_206647 [Aspergillus terricola var. indicus]
MDEIDEADQMPVEATPEDSDPLCYICSCPFWLLRTVGYAGEEGMTTDRTPLVLFHPLPWDENSGIIRSKKGHVDKGLCATALMDEASAAGLAHVQKLERLRGLVIHARCWQVLVNHKIWALTGGNIRLIMEALRRRSVKNWQWKTRLRPAGVKLHEKASAVARKKGDPFYSPRVLCMIRHARRRTRARSSRGKECRSLNLRLDLLPAEILFLIANRLPSSDVLAVQEAMGLYFGDAYWRSRIPSDFFHEVKGLTGQTLDWEYLCLKLELLNSSHYWVNSHNELLGRHWVLRQLDEAAKFIVR